MALKTVSNTSYNSAITMQTFLNEYNEILIGKRKNFSPQLLDKDYPEKTAADILRVIFEYYFDWTPVQVRDCLTPEIVTRMKLGSLIRKIPSPDEIIREKELYFVAWYLYPKTRNISEGDLVIQVYHHLMNGDIQRFPKNYFFSNLGNLRAKMIFKIALKEYILPRYAFSSMADVYNFFASDKVNAVMDECKLSTMIKQKAGLPLNMLHMALENEKYNVLYIKALEKCFTKNKWDQCILSYGEVKEALGKDTPKDYERFHKHIEKVSQKLQQKEMRGAY